MTNECKKEERKRGQREKGEGETERKKEKEDECQWGTGAVSALLMGQGAPNRVSLPII